MLRPALASDLPEILRIQAQCYPSIAPEQAAAYLNKLEQAPDCAFVIEPTPQHLAAYLFALPIRIEQPPALDSCHFTVPPQANCLYLHDLAIAPEAQGRKLSRPLLQAFFARAQQRQLHQCSLIAIQNSNEFWQRYGFRPHPLSTSPAMLQKISSYGDAVYLVRSA